MGTCLQGYISATYQQLVAVFGEPDYTDPSGDGKVNTEWEMYTEEYGPVTIYDWKDYDGGARSRSGEVYEWHIGGKQKSAVWYIQDKLGL